MSQAIYTTMVLAKNKRGPKTNYISSFNCDFLFHLSPKISLKPVKMFELRNLLDH